MAKARLMWVDIAKGIAILAVVLGHTYYGGVPAHTFVYSFHVPLFFVLAGYTFRVKSHREVLASSAKRLLLPYLVLALLAGIFDLAKGWINSETLLQFLGGVVYGSGGAELPWGIWSIGIPWFLMALFVARLIYNATLGFLERRNVHPVLQMVFYAAVAWVAHALAPLVALPFSLWQALIMMLFMHLGYSAKKYSWMEKAPLPLTLACLAIWVAGLVFGVFFSVGNLLFVKSFIAGVAMTAAASWCVMQASRLIERHSRPISRFLTFAGVNSLLILEMHVVETFCITWADVAFESLGVFSPVFTGVLHLAFVMGIVWLIVLSPPKKGLSDQRMQKGV